MTGSIRGRGIEEEFTFTASRSSGPGGQHVNRTSSKVELRFDVEASGSLSEEEKDLIRMKLSNRMNISGELVLTCQDSRSQHANKALVIERFYRLFEEALKPQKKRRKTKPTIASQQKRLQKKKEHSQKKKDRKRPFFD